MRANVSKWSEAGVSMLLKSDLPITTTNLMHRFYDNEGQFVRSTIDNATKIFFKKRIESSILQDRVVER